MICFFFSYSLFSTNADKIYYIRSQKKNAQLVYHGFIYNKKQTQANGQTTWRCSEMSKNRCRAVCITLNSSLVSVRREHQHQPHWERFTNRELYLTEQDIDAPSEMFTMIPADCDKSYWTSKNDSSPFDPLNQ